MYLFGQRNGDSSLLRDTSKLACATCAYLPVLGICSNNVTVYEPLPNESG